MKSTREQESISSSLTRLDRDSWARNEGALIGLIGDKGAKWPLICTREQFTRKKAPGGDEKQVMRAHETWDDANDSILDILSIAFRHCPDARSVIEKHTFPVLPFPVFTLQSYE